MLAIRKNAPQGTQCSTANVSRTTGEIRLGYALALRGCAMGLLTARTHQTRKIADALMTNFNAVFASMWAVAATAQFWTSFRNAFSHLKSEMESRIASVTKMSCKL